MTLGLLPGADIDVIEDLEVVREELDRPDTDTGLLRRLVDFVHEQTVRSGAGAEVLA
jgi:hypothetical protein